MQNIQALLELASARHSHLCPRQILGVRMALAGAAVLGLELPRSDKNMLIIAETDGCFVDGLEVAAGVSPGHRTLRIEDYGKVGATIINVRSGEAVRLAPQADARRRAQAYAPHEPRHYFAQLQAYQVMPDQELFSMRSVTLDPTIEQIVSRAGVRVNCSVCGEEIINEREITVHGLTYCRACIGQGYYREVDVAYPVGMEAAHILSNR